MRLSQGASYDPGHQQDVFWVVWDKRVWLHDNCGRWAREYPTDKPAKYYGVVTNLPLKLQALLKRHALTKWTRRPQL